MLSSSLSSTTFFSILWINIGNNDKDDEVEELLCCLSESQSETSADSVAANLDEDGEGGVLAADVVDLSLTLIIMPTNSLLYGLITV